MIRSLVGRGMRRVTNKKKGAVHATSAAPVATWTPSKKAESAPSETRSSSAPSTVASAASLLDWVDSVDEAAATVAAEPSPASEPAPSNGGESSFAALAALAAQGGLGKAVHADAGSTDLESYKARARANGRVVELAGEGMNTAADGISFWGPVDNESSRARADGLALTIDQHECISCGTCEENTDKVFLLPEAPGGQEEDKAEVLAQEGPMDLIQDAIDACPVTCIHWIPPKDLQEVHSHGGYVPE